MAESSKKRRSTKSKTSDEWHVSCPKKGWKHDNWNPTDLTVDRAHHLSSRPLSGMRSYEMRVYSLNARFNDFFAGEMFEEKNLLTWWRDSPFGLFSRCVIIFNKITGSRQFVFALLEHWWDTTNTFHFPWGEMTITPKDFAMLTGLEFTDRAVVVDDELKFGSEGVKEALGPVVDTIKPSQSYAKPEQIFNGIFMKDTTLAQKKRLLALFFINGYLVCGSGTSQRCYLRYLPSLRSLSSIASFSWASLAYVHLLNGMRYACRVDNAATTASCPGPFRIIEFWAFEYFPEFAPKRSQELACPVIGTWRESRHILPQDMFKKTRSRLCGMTADDVAWRPWTGVSAPNSLEDLNGLNQHAWIFSGGDEVAWYLSQRVVRQHSSDYPIVPLDPPSDMLDYEKLKKSFLMDKEPPEGYGVIWTSLVYFDLDYDDFIRSRLASPVVFQPAAAPMNFAEGEIPHAEWTVRYPGPSGEMTEEIPEPPPEALLSTLSIPDDFGGLTRDGTTRILRLLDGYRWRLQGLLSERVNQTRNPSMPFFPSSSSGMEGINFGSSSMTASTSSTTFAPSHFSMSGQLFFVPNQSQTTGGATGGAMGSSDMDPALD